MSILVPEAPTERAYLAGIIDGEGYICPRRASGGVTYYIGAVNTDLGLMNWLQSIGGYVYRCPLRTRRQVYDWRVHRQVDILALLQAIEPYMRIKRAKAQVVITHLSQRQATHKMHSDLELVVPRRKP